LRVVEVGQGISINIINSGNVDDSEITPCSRRRETVYLRMVL
jgi:hypothetical protein